MNPNEPTITVQADLVEPLCQDLGVLADWLAHASDEALDELAEFAYHDTGQARTCLTDLIADLGRYQLLLQRLLLAALRAQR